MRLRLAVAVAICSLLCVDTAHAHRIDEYLQATMLSLQTDRVQASMRLIPGVLVSPAVIAQIDSNADGVFSDVEERAYAQRVLDDLTISIDGKMIQPRLVSWSFPQPAQLRDGLGEIHIDYVADLPPGGARRSFVLANHHLTRASVYLVNALLPQQSDVQILAQKRNADQTLYQLDFQASSANVVATEDRWASLKTRVSALPSASLFRLGVRHIAEGTDHLLFLLTLLLPAPLLITGSRAARRWGRPASVRQSLMRIVAVVTAFTIGHSVTLSLAALGGVHVPSRPIEVLIAVSIFVSAIHALRPIVAGKEALIAGFFGLIHGLAFAATLDRLGLGRWERIAGILSFNLGIEAMQMLVVLAVLPSLLLLSRTRAYSILRVGGAIFAGVASLGWIVERSLNLALPVDTVVDALAAHAIFFAAALLLVSLLCHFLVPTGDHSAKTADPSSALSITPPFS